MSQPPPQTTERSVIVLNAVLADLCRRALAGERKYGTYLHTFNGRDALQDALEEAYDLAMYLKQAIMERDANADSHA